MTILNQVTNWCLELAKESKVATQQAILSNQEVDRIEHAAFPIWKIKQRIFIYYQITVGSIFYRIAELSWSVCTYGLLNKRFKSTFSLQYGQVCFFPIIHQPRIQNSWNTWWQDNLNVSSMTPESFSLTNKSLPQTAHTFCSKLRIGIPWGV